MYYCISQLDLIFKLFILLTINFRLSRDCFVKCTWYVYDIFAWISEFLTNFISINLIFFFRLFAIGCLILCDNNYLIQICKKKCEPINQILKLLSWLCELHSVTLTFRYLSFIFQSFEGFFCIVWVYYLKTKFQIQ